MATTRKRSSGFSSSPEEEFPESSDSNEVLNLEEEVQVPEPEPVVEVVQKTFVEESIVPTDDLGPRFLSTEEELAPTPQPKPLPELKPAPKRHPRNVPKFSRTR